MTLLTGATLMTTCCGDYHYADCPLRHGPSFGESDYYDAHDDYLDYDYNYDGTADPEGCAHMSGDGCGITAEIWAEGVGWQIRGEHYGQQYRCIECGTIYSLPATVRVVERINYMKDGTQ